MKKRSEETQTLRAGLVRPSQKFCHAADSLPGGRYGQNLFSWRWSLYLYLQTQFGAHRCTQFRVFVV